jgi:hypothetical protein
MFIALTRALDDPLDRLLLDNANFVLALEAPVASYAMEAAWARGGPGAPATLQTISPALVGATFGRAVAPIAEWSPIWDHLIYAYMIENTRIYEIFRRVLWEFAHGERLGIPQTEASLRWLQTTEELFYKDASPFQSWNLVSRVRPDIAGTRRNAYYRMFGMDLNHGRDGSTAYPYEKAAIANRDFVGTFEEFLRHVWRGIENANNGIGPNPTDAQAILDLSLRLQAMLVARRGGSAVAANLSREEFLAVSLMSWFALTVTFDTAIVAELRATGPTPEERLRQIGERIGLPMHPQSHSYFLIAPRISALLQEIEAGWFDTIPEIETLYAPSSPNPVRDDVALVIHHWSIISGRDMKAARTTLSPALTPPPTMLTVPAMPSASSASSLAGTEVVVTGSGNGSVPSRA